MTIFTTNYENNNNKNYEPVPEGNYECTIEKVGRDATKNGKEFLAVNLRIRKDLDKKLPQTNGKYHNRIVFGQFWKSEKNPNAYQDVLNALMECVDIPEGKTFESWSDIDDALAGKPVMVHITIEEDEYKGKKTKRNRIAPWAFSKTRAPFHKPQGDPFNGNEGADADDISDDDLPF